jgi:hypothetical protein
MDVDVQNEMKRILMTALFVLCVIVPTTSDARRLYYAEEFYLYVMNLYQVNPNLLRNIRFMQWALQAPFDNPVRSLAKIETENDFLRYQQLFKMHMNLLIIDSYLQLARRFDKEHVYFFNLRYAEDLKKSLGIARYFYEISFNYWDEALKYAKDAEKYPGRISIDAWEDELYLIQTGGLDYRTIIKSHLEKLHSRMQTVQDYLDRSG